MRIEIKGSIVPDDEAWVYEYFKMNCFSPSNMNQLLQKANGAFIDIYINSGGGNIFAASEIYDAIRRYQGKKKIHVVGMAGSAAGVIACAAASDITPTGMMMVHNVSAQGAAGDYHVQEKQSEILRKANEAIASAYIEKTGMSQKDALAMMDHETWLTAQDAVSYKLIDEIAAPAAESSVQLVAAVDGMLPPQVVEQMRNSIKSPNAQKAQAELDLLRLKGAITI